MKQVWLGLIVAVGFVLVAPRTARAECLEVGLRDQRGVWNYFHAWVDRADKQSGRIHLKYEFHNGEIDLAVSEKEKADGRDLTVMRGTWSDHHKGQNGGRVRVEMERGHYRARGWYTKSDDDNAPHLELVLRECSP